MKLILEIWKQEFSIRSLSVTHDKQSDFYTCQWQKTTNISIIYMLYRIAIALIFFVTLVLSIIDLDDLGASAETRAKWLIYLTHWGYTVCTLQAMLACYMVLRMYRKVRKRDEAFVPEPSPAVDISPKLCASYWVLYTIATDAAFAITCIYWTMIFNPKEHPVNAMNVFVHGVNSILMLTDLFVVAHPVRLLHCYWPFLFALSYITFNVVYYLAGGTDKDGFHFIYAILDWEKPGKSATVTFLALIFLVFLHLLTYCMFLLRQRIYKQCQTNNASKNIYAMDLRAEKTQHIFSEHSEYL